MNIENLSNFHMVFSTDNYLYSDIDKRNLELIVGEKVAEEVIHNPGIQELYVVLELRKEHLENKENFNIRSFYNLYLLSLFSAAY